MIGAHLDAVFSPAKSTRRVPTIPSKIKASGIMACAFKLIVKISLGTLLNWMFDCKYERVNLKLIIICGYDFWNFQEKLLEITLNNYNMP